jgi:hypothetical protein
MGRGQCVPERDGVAVGEGRTGRHEVEIDGRPIGDGKPGPASQRVHDWYWALRESGRDGTPIFSESVARVRGSAASDADPVAPD